MLIHVRVPLDLHSAMLRRSAPITAQVIAALQQHLAAPSIMQGNGSAHEPTPVATVMPATRKKTWKPAL